MLRSYSDRDGLRNQTSFSVTCRTALKLLANSYRTLRDLDSYVPFDYPVEALTASQLVGVLQAEQAKLTGVLARVDTAFNTKRFGIAANLAILVRLQHFVEEFQFRSQSYMPETAAKVLAKPILPICSRRVRQH